LRNAGSEEFAAVVFMGLSIARLSKEAFAFSLLGASK
jgi:hypothetical protein